MIALFQHTPIWVWVLFVFLMYRGIQSLRPRQMSPARLLFLPVIFFLWAVVSIATELQRLWVGSTGFLIGLMFGFAIGWALWRDSDVTCDPQTHTIKRPGSPWILILIMLAFVTKFVLHIFLARSPMLDHDSIFNMIYGTASGLFDGIFWGGTAVCFQALKRERNKVG